MFIIFSAQLDTYTNFENQRRTFRAVELLKKVGKLFSFKIDEAMHLSSNVELADGQVSV